LPTEFTELEATVFSELMNRDDRTVSDLMKELQIAPKIIVGALVSLRRKGMVVSGFAGEGKPAVWETTEKGRDDFRLFVEYRNKPSPIPRKLKIPKDVATI